MSEQSEYVLMPREATRTMTMAGCDSLPSCEHVFGHAGEMLSNAYRKMVEAGAVTTRAQTALKLNLEAARDAVREEIGSRLCHLTPHGTRICSRQVSSVCLCEETARAALCSQAPVPEGEPGESEQQLREENLRSLLREARQYVSDAYLDEDSEASGPSASLLKDIDEALSISSTERP